MFLRFVFVGFVIVGAIASPVGDIGQWFLILIVGLVIIQIITWFQSLSGSVAKCPECGADIQQKGSISWATCKTCYQRAASDDD